MRVDLYEVGGKIYFGEITLTSACGRMTYFTDQCLREMGALCAAAYNEINKI